MSFCWAWGTQRSKPLANPGKVEDGRGNLGHSATPRFPSPLIGRVENWRAGLGRCSCSLFSRPFVCECHSISTMPRFQSHINLNSIPGSLGQREWRQTRSNARSSPRDGRHFRLQTTAAA